jgi:hypothetical protein
MDFTTYRPLALRTAKMFPTARENLRHSVLGMITEIGEFATGVKRHVVYGKVLDAEITVDGKPTTILKNMREELGDAYWYFPLGFAAIGADPIEHKLTDELHGMDIVDKLFTVNALSGSIGAFIASKKIEEERSSIIQMLSVGVLGLDAVCQDLGFDPGEVRAENIAKLRLRFPGAYSDEAAEARADKLA